MIKSLIDRLGQYTANPDPLAKLAGTVAMVVASNQPFYPLYLYAIVGQLAWPAWFTLLSTPFFVAVPAIARRHSLAGRAMLPVTGVANTVLCVKLIGPKSAVELFLFPCILLAAILFRPAERTIMAPVLVLPFAAYLVLDGHLGPPIQVFGADSYASIIALHAISVASLTALIGILLASVLAERNAPG